MLPLFTEQGQNVCYEDSQEKESKPRQICIHWTGYPVENHTCELPNFGRMRKPWELTRILPAESIILSTLSQPILFGTLQQKSGLLLSWNWSRHEIYSWKSQAAGTPTELNWVQARWIKTDPQLHLSSLYNVTDCTQFSWGTSSCTDTTQKLCRIKKISNQLYTLYVASPVLSAQRKWRTQLLFSSLCWSSWREVTSSDVCIQSSRYRSHT